jgi:hypothetical protein
LGWGASSPGGALQYILTGADLDPVTGSECVQSVSYVSDSFVCAGQNGTGPCTYDDGAPLLYMVNNTWTIYGVVSDPSGCGASGTYGVFTKVSAYSEFLYGKDVGRSDGKLFGGYLCSGASATEVSRLVLGLGVLVTTVFVSLF